jgi:hypothetical protein
MPDASTGSTPVLRAPPRSAALATVARSARRPLVMIVGMHRSGTSLCSHVLSALGVDMADQLGPFGPPSPDNAWGHWERWEIVEFHDRVLELLNRRYVDPTHDFGFPVAWWADPVVSKIRNEIIAFLHHRMGDGCFGFKDPRTVRLMPIWHQIVSELKLAPRIVFCLRDPAQVARSLQQRDGLAPDVGEARWFSYVADFFRYHRDPEFCVIEFETWFQNPAKNIEKLQDFLELNWSQSATELDVTLSGIVDPELRHDDTQFQVKQPLVRSLYQLVRRAEKDHTARDQIRSLSAQFISFQQLHRGVYRRFEQLAATAERLAPLEQETASLREALAQRDASIEESRARAAAAEAAHSVAASENAGLSDMLAQAEQQRQQRETVLAGREAEIGQLRATLARSEQERLEREAVIARLQQKLTNAEQQRRRLEPALSASQSEISRLQDALMQIELQAQERQAAIAESRARVSDLQAKLKILELQLAERRQAQAASQQEIALLRAESAEIAKIKERNAGLQANVGKLQDLLARAANEQREREAALTANDAEIAELRGAVMQARSAVARAEEESNAVARAGDESRARVGQLERDLDAASASIETLREVALRAGETATQRTQAADALSAEIAKTRAELMVARQVGRRLLDALRNTA